MGTICSTQVRIGDNSTGNTNIPHVSVHVASIDETPKEEDNNIIAVPQETAGCDVSKEKSDEVIDVVLGESELEKPAMEQMMEDSTVESQYNTPTNPHVETLGSLTGLPSFSGVPDDVRKLIFGQFEVVEKISSSKVISIHISALFGDCSTELVSFMKNVYPNLLRYCCQQGYYLEICDLRWGCLDGFHDNQDYQEVCHQRLTTMQKLSVATIYIVFLNEKLGSNAPVMIDVNDFDMLLLDVQPSEKELIKAWYKLDENHVPPAYVLQPISHRFPDYLSSNEASRKSAVMEWTENANKIYQTLINVLPGDSSYLKTDFEQEIEMIIARNSCRVENNTIWIHRKLNDMPEIANENCVNYRDVHDSNYSTHLAKRLSRIHNLLKLRLNPENIIRLNIDWKEDGINDTDDTYLSDFNERTEKSLHLLIDGFISDDRQSLVKQFTRIHPWLHAQLCLRSQIVGDFSDSGCGSNEDATIITKVNQYLQLHCLSDDESTPQVKQPLLITGPCGVGKSHLVSMISRQVHNLEGWKDGVCVTQFCMSSPESRTLHQVMASSCLQMGEVYGLKTSKVMKSLSKGTEVLQDIFRKVDSSRPLLWIIDGLERIVCNDLMCLEQFIFHELPIFVHVILTIDSEYDNVINKIKEITNCEQNCLSVQKASVGNCMEIFSQSLELNHHEITPNQRLSIEKALTDNGLPLHALIFASLASTWKSSEYKDETVFPADSARLCQLLFDECEKYVGRAAFVNVVCYITASEHGLSFAEMYDLLCYRKDIVISENDSIQFISCGQILRLLSLLSPFLNLWFCKGIPLYAWKHGLFHNICSDRYNIKGYHENLAKYFQDMPCGQDTLNPRHFLQTSVQISYCDNESSVIESMLSNIDWISKKLRSVGIFHVLRDFDRFLKDFPENCDAIFVHSCLRDKLFQIFCDSDQFLFQLLLKAKNSELQNLPKISDFIETFNTNRRQCLLPNENQVSRIFSNEADFSSSSTPIITTLHNFRNTSDYVISLSDILGEIKIWSVNSGEVVRTFTGINSPRDIQPIDDRAVTVLCERELIVYDLDSGEKKSTLKGVLSVKMPYFAVQNDENIVALSRNRMYVNIMNISSGDMAATFKVGEDRFLNSLLVSRNGNVCICGDEVQKPFPLLVWDLAKRKLEYDIRMVQHEFITSMSAVSNEGHYLACVCKELDDPAPNFIVIYDLTSGQLFKKFKPACNTTCIAISSENQCVLAGLENNTIIIWDFVVGAEKFVLQGHIAPPRCIQMSLDGSTCLSHDESGCDISIRLWDVNTGLSCGTFIPDEPCTCCLLTLDGMSVVIGLPGIDDVVILRVRQFMQDTDVSEKYFGNPENNKLCLDLSQKKEE